MTVVKFLLVEPFLPLPVLLYTPAFILYEACSIVEKDSKEPISGEFPVLLSPPTGTCLTCDRVLSEHNRPTDIVVNGVCGQTKGLKFCLRCDHCMVNYNYN